MKTPSSILVVAAALFVALVATATSGAAGSQTRGFKFGVILPTSATDLNWSQTMAVASRDVTKRLGAELSMTDKVFDPTQARPLFNQLLGQETRLIFAHSFSYSQLVKELAAQNKDTIFVVAADGERPRDNISISTYSYLEMGYSQCWLAAKLSRERRDRQRRRGEGAVQHGDESGLPARREGREPEGPGARGVHERLRRPAEGSRGRAVAHRPRRRRPLRLRWDGLLARGARALRRAAGAVLQHRFRQPAGRACVGRLQHGDRLAAVADANDQGHRRRAVQDVHVRRHLREPRARGDAVQRAERESSCRRRCGRSSERC